MSYSNEDIIPKLGEIRKPSLSLGIKYSRIWLECPECGKCRWVLLKDTRQDNFTGLCIDCSRKQSRHRQYKPYKHKDGRIPAGQGYYKIKLMPIDDFFLSMANKNGYIFEHRLIIAKHLGRNLHRWEIVHHRDGNRSNNRIENLQLVTDDRHKQITILENRIRYLEGLLTTAGVKFNGR